MPSYMELLIQETRQQRSEQARQHDELLAAIAHLTQATQRVEQALARLEAQARASVQAQGVAQAQAQDVAQAQAPPPAENLHWLGRLGRWGGRILEVAKNAAKAITCKRATRFGDCGGQSGSSWCESQEVSDSKGFRR
jgi:hypothetical protein